MWTHKFDKTPARLDEIRISKCNQQYETISTAKTSGREHIRNDIYPLPCGCYGCREMCAACSLLAHWHIALDLKFVAEFSWNLSGFDAVKRDFVFRGEYYMPGWVSAPDSDAVLNFQNFRCHSAEQSLIFCLPFAWSKQFSRYALSIIVSTWYSGLNFFCVNIRCHVNCYSHILDYILLRFSGNSDVIRLASVVSGKSTKHFDQSIPCFWLKAHMSYLCKSRNLFFLDWHISFVWSLLEENQIRLREMTKDLLDNGLT